MAQLLEKLLGLRASWTSCFERTCCYPHVGLLLAAGHGLDHIVARTTSSAASSVEHLVGVVVVAAPAFDYRVGELGALGGGALQSLAQLCSTQQQA